MLGVLLALAASCHDDPAAAGPPRRPCGLTVWYRPSSPASRVEIVSSWSAWARPGDLMANERADGWRVEHFDLPAGEHTYAILDDGAWVTDPSVPTTAFRDDGQEVTWVDVPRCDVPRVRVDGLAASADGHATIDATFLSAGADPIEPRSVTLTARDGRALPVDLAGMTPAAGAIHLAAEGLAPGKHALVLAARDAAGRVAEPANVTLWIEPRPFDLRDAVLYHVMIDRFRGDAGPLAPPQSPSARAGGTLRGLTTALDEIAALGANTIWISPLYLNPDGEFPGNDGHSYSSYHGYWPIASRATDPRVATEADVDAFVTAAHARGIRVLFDVVPNHVHEQHPYWRERRKDAWFNEATPTCVCGQAACDWGAHIQECWFAPYMPDLDWKNPDVARQGADDVLFWLDRFDADGVRIDAVPMMPRAATRRIVAAIRARYGHAGNPMMLLGENFTGPGGYRLLKYQLGPFGLDSQFHFPLMWALRSAVAGAGAPMSDVAAAVEAGEEAWRGSGAVMATMIGNHDVSRFTSESAGDGAGDGWSPAPQPTDPRVYEKQRLALGVIFTLPGAPVVYYGDEVALAGRADPDARRVMPSEAALTALQEATRAFAQKLGAARACVPALRRGGYRTLVADAEHVVFAREGDGIETAIVVASRAPLAPLTVPFPGVPPGEYVDVLSGGRATLTSELTKIDPAPFSVRVLVASASAVARECASDAR